MSYKNLVKDFLLKFKRVIVASGICFLAVAIIGIVAYKSTSNNSLNEQTVQTSAPSKVNFILPITNGVVIKDFSNTSLKYNSTLRLFELSLSASIRAL